MFSTVFFPLDSSLASRRTLLVSISCDSRGWISRSPFALYELGRARNSTSGIARNTRQKGRSAHKDVKGKEHKTGDDTEHLY